MAQSAPPPRQPPHPEPPHPAPISPPQETEAERRTRAVAEEEATRAKAEAATAHLPRQGTPLGDPMSALAAFPDEPTVLMNLPELVTLTLRGEKAYTMVTFPAGVQPVPKSLVDEQWLKDSGVTPVAR